MGRHSSAHLFERIQLHFQAENEKLQWSVTIAEATDNLTQMHLPLSEFEFDIVHCAGVNHHSVDIPLRFKIKDEDEIL